jgi:lipopolysaccharide/colanic/teichoic acid biosynthesis glycosyltransferase
MGQRAKGSKPIMAKGFFDQQGSNGASRRVVAGNSRDGELTQLLRLAMADAPCSPEALAAVLPRWKRALDFTIIALTLPIWLPLMVFIALWVAVTSPGPIFYRQPRVGFKGRRFMIVKFRTMKVNAETRSHETYLEQLMVSDMPMMKLDAKGDPRLIIGGKLLRAVGLDELPQLFNVFRGEMSIVGPRPCTVREFELYAPEDRERVNALPGLTGFWQVNGKNRTTFRQMVDMDVFYSTNLSLWMDLKIIVRTFPAIASQLIDMWQALPRARTRSTAPVTNSTVDNVITN